MLGFQVAMLSDEELVRPALEGIEAGASAAAAWEAAMEVEIAGYRDAGDDHFSARTADLEDIRDRVLGHLEPGAAGAAIPAGAVVVAADLPLSRFLAIDWARGGAILLTRGSPTSHVAMLARARGVPMVVGLDGAADAHGRPARPWSTRPPAKWCSTRRKPPGPPLPPGPTAKSGERGKRRVSYAPRGHQGRNQDRPQPQRQFR